MFTTLGQLRRVLHESMYVSELFPDSLKPEIERQFGEIQEIHYEDSKCEDENGNLISNPYFTIVTTTGLVTAILTMNFKRIEELHGPSSYD